MRLFTVIDGNPYTYIKAYVLTLHLKHAYNQKQKILAEAATRDGITPRTCPSWDISTKPLHTSGAVCYFDGEVYHIFEYDTRDYTHQRVGDVEETLFYLLHYYAQEAAIRYAEKQAADKTMWDRRLANDKFVEYMALLGEPYARLAAKKINNA